MKTTTTLFIFIYILCFYITRSDARQGDALASLRLMSKSNFNISLIEEFEINIDEVRVHPQTGLKEKDLIEKLPGQPHVRFTQYGGYVTIDEKAGRALYYYFTEAERSKKLKPLLLWFNGGPGCSSLGYGAMEELGPFRVHSNGKTLYENPYAWNKVANVLFLESPAGVGFSYSNTTSDYGKGGDKMTAADNYLFLVNWLERFPEYKDRDFYISGESYAGHFVPELAHSILQHNKRAKKSIINLKGIIIGNACINEATDNLGVYDYLWTHAIISDETIQGFKKYCKLPFSEGLPQQCDDALHEISVATDEPFDGYNIYAPMCLNDNLTDTPKETSIVNFDPCSYNYVETYLNSPDVQKALHANVTKLNYPWGACNNLAAWATRPSTMLPILRELMSNGLRVWVYSGDVDSIVPVTSTRYSLNKLKLSTKTPWYPWSIHKELGGYAIVYKGDLTFITVRGAGHEVPSYQPQRALALIKHFLDGTPLPQARPQE